MGNTGVIYNTSLLPLQYITYDSEQSVIKDQSQFEKALQYKTTVDNVTFEGFYRKSEATFPKHEGQFIPIKFEEKFKLEIKESDFGRKRLTVRSEVGEYVNYVIRDRLIESLQDMCIRVMSNLSYRQLNEHEIHEYLGLQPLPIPINLGDGGLKKKEDEEGLKLREIHTSESIKKTVSAGLIEYQKNFEVETAKKKEERLKERERKIALNKRLDELNHPEYKVIIEDDIQ